MLFAGENSKVKVHYTGKFDDGTVFDSSLEREPLEFVIGSGQVIPGFDKGLIGMKVNDKKNIHIPSKEAYGDYREDMIIKAPRSNFPGDVKPEIGMQLQMRQEDSSQMLVLVREFDDEFIILDANHPLAGQNLNFDLELVEIL